MILKCATPESDWSICSIRILGKKIFGNYSEAVKQSKKGTYTSDLTSSESDAPRTRITRRFSTSDEESDNDVLNIPLPRPSFHTSKFSNITSSQTEIVPAISQNPEPLECQNAEPKSYNSEPAKSQSTGGCMCSSLKRDVEKLILTLTKQYALMSTRLDDIANDMAHVTTYMSENKIAPGKTSQLKYDFPLKTEDSLTEFEAFLGEEKNYKLLINYIIKIGGMTPYDAVKRTLSRIFTNQLASNFSWMGAKGKKEFRTLKLARALIVGIQGSPHTTTASETDIEKSIKTWLRHAKERAAKEL